MLATQDCGSYGWRRLDFSPPISTIDEMTSCYGRRIERFFTRYCSLDQDARSDARRNVRLLDTAPISDALEEAA